MAQWCPLYSHLLRYCVSAYVHAYVMCIDIHVYVYSVNRRMDEWVTVERVDVERGPVEETPKDTELMLETLNGRERKVTRNLKRKHDEINHVQKVTTCIYTVQYIYTCTCVDSCKYMYVYKLCMKKTDAPFKYILIYKATQQYIH